MADTSHDEQVRLIAEIVELQRTYYFENKNKDSERRRELRKIIERVTPAGDGADVA